MVKPLSKWILKAYSKLWTEFKNKAFTHKDKSKTLNDNKMVSVILSDLKKAGWLEVRLDPSDSRKRLYKLIGP
jgi:hypothetical protein